jgi:hypothetical protein
MRTYTGRFVDPMNLKVSDIDIMDICHHLSHICRFGGGTRYHYSVGQHSVLVSQVQCTTECLLTKPYCPPPDASQHRRQKFAHDFTEAYLGDIPRPIKYLPEFAAYRDAETKAHEVICQAFGIPAPMPPCVHTADNQLLVAEGAALMNYSYRKDYGAPGNVKIEPWTPEETRVRFMDRYRELFL